MPALGGPKAKRAGFSKYSMRGPIAKNIGSVETAVKFEPIASSCDLYLLSTDLLMTAGD